MPIDEVFVSSLPGDRRAAARARGRLVRLAVSGGDEPERRTGELHLGRIVRILPGVGGVLVEIGAERPGILMRADVAPGEPLAEGGSVVVRVTREAEAGKGAKLSALLSPAELALAAEARAMRPPGRLSAAVDPVVALLRAVAGPALARVVVDDASALAELRGEVPGIAGVLRLWQGPGALFAREGLDEEIALALAPVVPLPSGGRVTLEHTAAVTTVDVDLGAAAAGGSARGSALSVDLEAAEAIGRQIVLRDVGGAIVVDFVPVRRAAERARIADALQAALAEDDRALRIGGWTRLGLFELTRQRVGPPLGRRISAPCDVCLGFGRTPAAWWQAGDALRAVAADASHGTGGVPRLAASPAVAAALTGRMAAARAAVEAKVGRPIELTPVPEPMAEGFRLEPPATLARGV